MRVATEAAAAAADTTTYNRAAAVTGIGALTASHGARKGETKNKGEGGATLMASPGKALKGRTQRSLLVNCAVLVEVKLLEDPVGHVHELLGEVELLHHGGHVLLFL